MHENTELRWSNSLSITVVYSTVPYCTLNNDILLLVAISWPDVAPHHGYQLILKSTARRLSNLPCNRIFILDLQWRWCARPPRCPSSPARRSHHPRKFCTLTTTQSAALQSINNTSSWWRHYMRQSKWLFKLRNLSCSHCFKCNYLFEGDRYIQYRPLLLSSV